MKSQRFENIGSNIITDSEGRIDAAVMAREIDLIALGKVSEVKGTIASIADEQKKIVSEVLESGARVDTDEVLNRLELFHSERMVEISGDTRAKVGFLDGSVAGYYDGADIVLDTEYIDKTVYLHERQHESDGIDERLDDALFEETGILELDEQMKDIGVRRDVLEERAMDASSDIPDAYRETHWKTVKALEERGEHAGVNIETASKRLIENDDEVGFQEHLIKIAITELMEDRPDRVEDIEDAAEKASKSQILHVIDQVRAETTESSFSKENQLVA